MRQQIENALLGAVDEVNSSRAASSQISKDLEAPLLGEGGSLDSLGLVNFAVTAEENLEVALRANVPLVASIGLGRDTSPFRTLATLIEFVERSLRGPSARGG